MAEISLSGKRIIPLNEINPLVTNKIIKSKSKKPILLVVDSIGGDLDCAYKISDYIGHRSNSQAIVTGSCNSATIPILLSCSKRYCLPSATLFFHSLTIGARIKIIDLLDQEEVNKQIKQALDVHHRYVKHISSFLSLEPEEITEFMRDNVVINAKQALELGFVDNIIRSFKIN